MIVEQVEGPEGLCKLHHPLHELLGHGHHHLGSVMLMLVMSVVMLDNVGLVVFEVACRIQWWGPNKKWYKSWSIFLNLVEYLSVLFLSRSVPPSCDAGSDFEPGKGGEKTDNS